MSPDRVGHAAPDLAVIAPRHYVLPDMLCATSFHAMGTTVQVILEPGHEADAEAVRTLFAEWEATLSRFLPASELSRLNARAGEMVPVSALLLRVLRAALAAARATDGLFDPTLEHQLSWLGYDRSFEFVAPNQPASGYRVYPGGGWRAVTIIEGANGCGTVRLPEGIGLDFGGIGKGMAVDAALALLATRGVTRAMVNAGGDLSVLGLPPGAAAWPLAIEDGLDGVPRWPVSLRQGALATSGIARRRWRQGAKERHHLLDPRTGLPSPSVLRSVSVSATTCAQAEVAAKVAFLLGADGARFLVDHGLAGFLVWRDGTVRRVGGWPAEAENTVS